MLKLELEKKQFGASTDKHAVSSEIERYINLSGYKIADKDIDRPWGAFFRFETTDAARFLKEFFPELESMNIEIDNQGLELSPKILIVSPGQRLSWQYHSRRAEIWRFLTEGQYVRSLNDEENDIEHANKGDIVSFQKEERHRLVGLEDKYAFVAEIWQHTDPTNLSDEDDIVRLQDDYKR